jgi:RNA polymerase sigma-70 factor (ECF subfamily)
MAVGSTLCDHGMPPFSSIESKTELVQRALRDYEGALVGYACSILGDPDRARDVVQDTFIRLWDQDPARVAENLKPWLYTVCRNRSLDVLRRHRRVVELDELTLQRQEEQSPDPCEKLANQETTSEILRYVDRLPANQREVIRLKFQADLSYKEIAGLTGLSVTNVGFLLHTALKRLRTLLEPTRSSFTP